MKPLSVKKINFHLKTDRFQFWSFTQAYQQSINEDIANQRPVFMQYSIVPGSFEQFEDAFDINEIEKSFPNPISGVYLLFKEESMIDAPIGIIIIDSFLDKSGCVSEFIGFLPNHRKHGYGGLALNWLTKEMDTHYNKQYAFYAKTERKEHHQSLHQLTLKGINANIDLRNAGSLIIHLQHSYQFSKSKAIYRNKFDMKYTRTPVIHGVSLVYTPHQKITHIVDNLGVKDTINQLTSKASREKCLHFMFKSHAQHETDVVTQHSFEIQKADRKLHIHY